MACTASKTPLLRTVAARGYSAQAATKKAVATGEVHSTVLPNKLVVASTESNSPLSYVSIVFRAGSKYESYETRGASHLLRVAAGLSTKKASSFAITRNIQQTGGSLSVSSDREIICYNVQVSRDHLDTGLQFLEAAAIEQTFKPWELADNLHRVKNDIARVSQPVRAVELVHKAAFHGGLGNSIFCPKHQISKLSSEALQHFYASNFTTNRCAVVGVGIDHQLLVGFAQSLHLESGAGKEVGSQKYSGNGEARKDKATSSASVVIAGEGAGWKDPKEALAFYVLQFAAGAGASTKWGNSNGALSKAIASAGSDAVGASAFNASYTDTGLFGFTVAGDGRDIGRAIDAGVKALKSGSVSDADVARGKAQLKALTLFYGENMSGLGDLLAQSAKNGDGKVNNVKAWLDAIDSVQTSDCRAALKKVASSKLSIGAVGNLANVPHADQIN